MTSLGIESGKHFPLWCKLLHIGRIFRLRPSKRQLNSSGRDEICTAAGQSSEGPAAPRRAGWRAPCADYRKRHTPALKPRPEILDHRRPNQPLPSARHAPHVFEVTPSTTEESTVPVQQCGPKSDSKAFASSAPQLSRASSLPKKNRNTGGSSTNLKPFTKWRCW